VLESVAVVVEQRGNLKVNRGKSAVRHAREATLLGFGFYFSRPGVKIRADAKGGQPAEGSHPGADQPAGERGDARQDRHAECVHHPADVTILACRGCRTPGAQTQNHGWTHRRMPAVHSAV
jgi:hypothetical protein